MFEFAVESAAERGRAAARFYVGLPTWRRTREQPRDSTSASRHGSQFAARAADAKTCTVSTSAFRHGSQFAAARRGRLRRPSDIKRNRGEYPRRAARLLRRPSDMESRSRGQRARRSFCATGDQPVSRRVRDAFNTNYSRRREQPRREQPRREQPRREQPRREQPRREQPRREQPRREQPRATVADRPLSGRASTTALCAHCLSSPSARSGRCGHEHGFGEDRRHPFGYHEARRAGRRSRPSTYELGQA
jgi:hypothetical protein